MVIADQSKYIGNCAYCACILYADDNYEKHDDAIFCPGCYEEATEAQSNPRLVALANYLKCSLSEVSVSKYDDMLIEYGSEEYLVLTDSEADDRTTDYIKDSIWAFNADFIVSECGLPYELAEVFQAYQSDKCESANDAMLALIEKTCGLDEFVKDAISADGRGHFISSYDGEENEEGEYFIYRIN